MREYLLLLYEWFKTTEKCSLIFNGIISILIAIVVYNNSINIPILNIESIQSDLLSVIGVLLGFSFSVFTIFLTADGTNIEKAKKEILENAKIGTETISLYISIVISFTFIIVLEGFLLLFCIIYPLLLSINSGGMQICFAISILFFTLSVLMTLRLILDFYFIITKKIKE